MKSHRATFVRPPNTVYLVQKTFQKPVHYVGPKFEDTFNLDNRGAATAAAAASLHIRRGTQYSAIT